MGPRTCLVEQRSPGEHVLVMRCVLVQTELATPGSFNITPIVSMIKGNVNSTPCHGHSAQNLHKPLIIFHHQGTFMLAVQVSGGLG